MGGGRATASVSNEDPQLDYLEPRFAQAPQRNIIPHVVGNGQNSSVVYVPADTGRGVRPPVALVGRR